MSDLSLKIVVNATDVSNNKNFITKQKGFTHDNRKFIERVLVRGKVIFVKSLQRTGVEVIQQKDSISSWDPMQVNVVQTDQPFVNNYIHSIMMVAQKFPIF